jgi:sulfur-carrier protein
MATINFTSALKRFYPDLKPVHVEAATIGDILLELNQFYPNLSDFLVDEHGALRQHINIFIGDSMINDRETLADKIKEKDEILIFQALSGG